MTLRIIAKLDVKPPFVVKPVHFEGLRKVGEPAELAYKYYQQGADEIIYIDIVSSLYQRKLLTPYIEETAEKVLVPLGVGGGVRSLDDFSNLFHSGADKVLVNTEVVQNNPDLINQAAKTFGAQSVVLNIEAKQLPTGTWECYTDCGRIRSSKDALEWVQEAAQRGAGEIVLQSVDRDGRCLGFDLELIQKVVSLVDIPVVAASGAGSLDDILAVARIPNLGGIAIASLLHYDEVTIHDIREFLRNHGLEV